MAIAMHSLRGAVAWFARMRNNPDEVNPDLPMPAGAGSCLRKNVVDIANQLVEERITSRTVRERFKMPFNPTGVRINLDRLIEGFSRKFGQTSRLRIDAEHAETPSAKYIVAPEPTVFRQMVKIVAEMLEGVLNG